MLRNSIVSSLEHLEMLILEVHPFLVDPPPPWGKLKIRKVGLLTGNITYRAKRMTSNTDCFRLFKYHDCYREDFPQPNVQI